MIKVWIEYWRGGEMKLREESEHSSIENAMYYYEEEIAKWVLDAGYISFGIITT